MGGSCCSKSLSSRQTTDYTGLSYMEQRLLMLLTIHINCQPGDPYGKSWDGFIKNELL